METIRLTGPGLLTKLLFELFCSKEVKLNYDDKVSENINDNNINDNNSSDDSNNDSNNDNNIHNNIHDYNNNDNNNNNNNYYLNKRKPFDNVIIFPYTVFNPVPNNEITDVTDENSINAKKEKYLKVLYYRNEYKNENKNESRNENQDGNGNGDENNNKNESLDMINKNERMRTENEIKYKNESSNYVVNVIDKKDKMYTNYDTNKEKSELFNSSYAIHWWTRSWQK